MHPYPVSWKETIQNYLRALEKIAGDEMYFQIVSQTGDTIDSGVVEKPATPPVRSGKSSADPSRLESLQPGLAARQ